ncbi:MAG: ribosome small subunit-dependent GTPase A [Bacteroidota bacterium]|jgi:ribosome biogenesis GTPase
MFEGRVLKSTGSWFEVELPNQKIISCRIRGQLRLKGISSTNPVAVGDIVHVQEQTDGTGVITDINDRTNYIIRKSINLSKQTHILAANIDYAWIVVTPVFPKTSTGFIDRFIAAAESYHIPVGIIFNKSDLFVNHLSEIQHEYLDIYESLGYKCIKVSSQTKEGIDELKLLLDGKVNLLTGHSGVGKSSLINSIIPDLNLKVGEISKQHLKGKHTTTFAEMHKVDNSTYIIDTPGIREFVNIDFVPSEISHYFIEMRELLNDCKFNNCLHENEQQCAVKAAYEAGKIHPDRYYNYLSILHNEDNFK